MQQIASRRLSQYIEGDLRIASSTIEVEAAYDSKSHVHHLDFGSLVDECVLESEVEVMRKVNKRWNSSSELLCKVLCVCLILLSLQLGWMKA